MANNAHQNRNISLFLLPNFSEDPPFQLECMQIDLVTEQKAKITFTNPSVTENIFLENHSCISHGSTVLIVGGNTAAEEPTEAIHKFDTLAKTWTRGPNMTVKRSGFAWGVFGNRLYIAGGYGGRRVGNVRVTDVYDFGTGELRQAASMPISVTVNVFFTFSGKLYLAGSVHLGGLKFKSKYLSYCPERNEWTEEDSWLRQVLKDFGARAMVFNKFVVTGDNELYMLEASDEARVSSYVGDGKSSLLTVSKLDKSTLKWKRVYGMLDGESPGNCQCLVTRELWFLAAGSKVIVMMHNDDEDEGQVTPIIDEIMGVSVLCPSAWSSAIVNG